MTTPCPVKRSVLTNAWAQIVLAILGSLPALGLLALRLEMPFLFITIPLLLSCGLLMVLAVQIFDYGHIPGWRCLKRPFALWLLINGVLNALGGMCFFSSVIQPMPGDSQLPALACAAIAAFAWLVALLSFFAGDVRLRNR